MEKTYDLHHMTDSECADAIFEIAYAAALQGFSERMLLRYGIWYMANRRWMYSELNKRVTVSDFMEWARDWSMNNGM